MKKLPSQERLKELFVYNEDTGVFTWRIKKKQMNVGDDAGYVDSGRYRKIKVNNVAYPAHRLAWMYVHGREPENQIDHINKNMDDNSIKNLRDVTITENAQNQRLASNNTSGITGVYWKESRKRWVVTIMVNGKVIFLGRYKNIGDAKTARLEGQKKYNFHENHGKST